MKKIFVILVLSLVLCGCNNSKEGANETIPTLNEVSEVEKLMQENEYVIIDVRTNEEYMEGHVVGSINIPYDEIDKNIKINKSKLVFVYCKSGRRSSIAYDTLTSLGYNVYDLGAYSEIELEKEV